jgi:hypothetical protein
MEKKDIAFLAFEAVIIIIILISGANVILHN